MKAVHLRKTTLIQFGMECVRGPLKFQLMMTTVTRIETVFMMKVNRRYLRKRFTATSSLIQTRSYKSLIAYKKNMND